MPTVENALLIPRPLSEVFAFFSRPANLIPLTPPDLNLELLDAPEQLQAGAVVLWRVQRMGIPQQLQHEITHFEPDRLIVVRQRQGPFRTFVQTQQFSAAGATTELRDRIDFEPPGGILGQFITAEWIAGDLEESFAYREEKVRAMFG